MEVLYDLLVLFPGFHVNFPRVLKSPVVALNISFIPMVYFCYPETRGLSLEQIDHDFYGKGTSTNWLYQGVRESVLRQSALPAAADPEISLSEQDQKEVTVARHIDNPS